jgi:hypothetical protein
MEFSTWLLINEDARKLSKNPETASVISEILIKIMSTTGIIEEKLSFGSLGMRPRNPGRFYRRMPKNDGPAKLDDPFSSGDAAKPTWEAPKEEEKEEEDGIFRKIKDSMLLLRYKAMNERQDKIYQLGALEMPEDKEAILDLLEELGYIKPTFYTKSLKIQEQKLKTAIENALNEKGNLVPSAYQRLVSSKSIEQFQSDFLNLIKYMYEKNHLPHDTDALFGMINQLTNRTASGAAMKARDWSWPWLNQNSESEQEIKDKIKSGMGLIGASDRKDQMRKEKYERPATAFGSSPGGGGEDSQEDGDVMTNFASPESSSFDPEQRKLIFSKFTNIINQLKTKDRFAHIAFCIKFGLDPNGLNTIDDLTPNELRKNSKGGDPRKPSEQIAEKMLAHLAPAEQHLATPQKAGAWALSGEKFVKQQICLDNELKNSEYGDLFNC